ncbi:hypothetical protein [Robiginitalea sp. IMCC43444]|uniref:hypothetical protein n=1 Tax=Robiginitalea sp. IMCC43444 TaxID=3459121 RepID=UPI0040422670
MLLGGSIQNLSRELKTLIILYLLITSVGFLSALQFVRVTSEGNPKGIQENYLGNEDDPEALELKFAKSEKQILNIVHSHMLAMGMLFLILAFLVYLSPVTGILRKVLLFEPLISVFLTFGGIYLLWKEILWMRYVIMVSGTLMSISYVVSVILLLYWLCRKKVPRSIKVGMKRV